MTRTEQFLSEKTAHVFKGEKRWEAIQRGHETGSANRTDCSMAEAKKGKGARYPSLARKRKVP